MMKKHLSLAVFILILLLGIQSTFVFGEEIRNWQMMGPFSKTTVSDWWRSQFEIDYLKTQGGEKSETFNAINSENFNNRFYSWVPVLAKDTGVVDCKENFVIDTGLAVFYAFTEIDRPQDGKAVIGVGCNGAIRIWLNGKEVADNIDNEREFTPGKELFPVHFKAGKNYMLVKIHQMNARPAIFNVKIIPPYTLADHGRVWFPILLIILVWFAVSYYFEKTKPKDEGLTPGRLVSLDALRGFDMFWITGGGTVITILASRTGNYALMKHMDHMSWDGFVFWDLIFPLFLFIVGTAVPYAFAKRLERGESKIKLVRHIVLRSIGLFLIGIILAGGFSKTNLSDLRIPGVLQRIAICYGIAAIIYLYTNWKKQIGIGIAILLGYWAIMKLVPVPGLGAGNLTPDNNLANWIDFHYLPGNLYQGTWDNEGIMSTFPAIVTCMIGVLTGQWLRSSKSQNEKAAGLFKAAISFLVIGFLWGFLFPINKLLWSSSYVLIAGGWSLMLLGIFYWVIDVKGYRKWAFPFLVIGANAIATYAIRPFIKFSDIASRIAGGNVAAVFGNYRSLWLSAITYLLIWLVVYWLYKKKIFIKL